MFSVEKHEYFKEKCTIRHSSQRQRWEKIYLSDVEGYYSAMQCRSELSSSQGWSNILVASFRVPKMIVFHQLQIVSESGLSLYYVNIYFLFLVRLMYLFGL